MYKGSRVYPSLQKATDDEVIELWRILEGSAVEEGSSINSVRVALSKEHDPRTITITLKHIRQHA